MRLIKLFLIILLVFSMILLVQAQDDAEPGDEGAFAVGVVVDGIIGEIGDGYIIIDNVLYWLSAEIDTTTLVVGDPISFTVILAGDVTMTISLIEAPAGEVEEGLDPTVEHPVALAISEGVGVPYEEVWGWAENDFGFGEIARAYLLANEAGVEVMEIFAMRTDMNMGWGQIVREYGVSPALLAPGKLINGSLVLTGLDLPTDVAPDGELDSPTGPDNVDYSQYEPEVVEETVRNQGNAGTNKFGCEGRGNSCNAPGHNKDDGTGDE